MFRIDSDGRVYSKLHHDAPAGGFTRCLLWFSLPTWSIVSNQSITFLINSSRSVFECCTWGQFQYLVSYCIQVLPCERSYFSFDSHNLFDDLGYGNYGSAFINCNRIRCIPYIFTRSSSLARWPCHRERLWYKWIPHQSCYGFQGVSSVFSCDSMDTYREDITPATRTICYNLFWRRAINSCDAIFRARRFYSFLWTWHITHSTRQIF